MQPTTAFSTPGLLTGQATTTDRAPAARCGSIASAVVNFPLDSITTSTPSPAQSIAPGVVCSLKVTRWPSTTMASPSMATVPS